MGSGIYLSRRAVALATDLSPARLTEIANRTSGLAWSAVGSGGDAVAPLSRLRTALAQHVEGVDELLEPMAGPSLAVDEAAARTGRDATELLDDIDAGTITATWQRAGSTFEPRIPQALLEPGGALAGAARGSSLLGRRIAAAAGAVVAVGGGAAAVAALRGGGHEPTVAKAAGEPQGSHAAKESDGSSATRAADVERTAKQGKAPQTKLTRVAGAEADRVVRDVEADGSLSSEVASYQEANDQTPSPARNWQVDFAVWVGGKAGLTMGYDGDGVATSQDLVDWAKDRDAFTPKGKGHPKVGDMVALNVTSDGRGVDSIGIVEAVDEDAGTITVVQGNVTTRDKVGDVPVGVVTRLRYEVGARTVVGFIDAGSASKHEGAAMKAEREREAEAAKKAEKAGKATRPEGAYIPGSAIKAVVGDSISDAEADEIGRALGPAFVRYGIDTPTRAAAAIAQFALESAAFRTTTEYASGAAYEGRDDLGNTHRGDGVRFKGRGYIQITGRSNYEAVSAAFGKDFTKDPTALAKPKYAAMASAWWWKNHGCNALADSGDFVALTRRINGGTRGLAERQAYWAKAKRVADDLVPRQG
jgi:putative chitinase